MTPQSEAEKVATRLGDDGQDFDLWLDVMGADPEEDGVESGVYEYDDGSAIVVQSIGSRPVAWDVRPSGCQRACWGRHCECAE